MSKRKTQPKNPKVPHFAKLYDTRKYGQILITKRPAEGGMILHMQIRNEAGLFAEVPLVDFYKSDLVPEYGAEFNNKIMEKAFDELTRQGAINVCDAIFDADGDWDSE